jgi:hypothetical protein
MRHRLLVAGILGVACGFPGWVTAQTVPGFAVAAVKPSAEATTPVAMLPLIMLQPGRLSARNATVRALLRTAYGVEDFQIDGGPSWTVFVLVRDRADGSLGPDRKQSAVDWSTGSSRCGVAPFGRNGGFAMRATGQGMPALVRLLSQALGQPVIDRTSFDARGHLLRIHLAARAVSRVLPPIARHGACAARADTILPTRPRAGSAVTPLSIPSRVSRCGS